MKIATHKKVRTPKRKREYLPLAYAIRKHNATILFTITTAMKAVSSAIQLANIQSQRLEDKASKAKAIVELFSDSAKAISEESNKLSKVY